MHKGSLFTSAFLIKGIKATPYWNSIGDAEVSQFQQTVLGAFNAFPVTGEPNESTTERDLIEPVIRALGWSDFLTQQTAAKKGRSDVPDYLLFKDTESKNAANNESEQANRYKHGLAILEAKAWHIPLDRKETSGMGVPSNQIIRYLSIVDVQSDRAVKWGLLTNGREWRLYYQDAKSRSEEFLSLDLPVILGLKDFEPDLFASELAEAQDWLKVFYAFFRKAAFIKEGPQNLSFHEIALAEGRYWETKVAEDLSGVVFTTALPGFAKGLASTDTQKPAPMDSAYLAELREATLIFLYRLLFILYAEDRNLLPVTGAKYDEYGLRKRVRDDIRKRIDSGDVFSGTVGSYYRHIIDLCRAIDKGDQSIGLPPYNGGLFDENRAPLLKRALIPDAVFAPLFDRLSRHYEGDKRSWINYRDLSVQQLGSIYERFLEYELAEGDDGSITIRPNMFSRKTTGSYYTPDSLVSLIIENSVGPLIDEGVETFREKAETLKSQKSSKAERLKELGSHDPASHLLDLRVLDPAMGSGHFLVSLVDYLADRLLILMEEAESLVEWADENRRYASPITKNVKEIRNHILDEAKRHKWIVRDDQLDDRHLVRRMILKRCVFGVDKNPMAVELAKVALWLHTFTVGAPLSFLDHHLRCGDSLFGEFTHGVEEELKRRGSLFISSEVARAKATAKGMAIIESLTDADIAEVKESAAVFMEVSKGSRQLTRFYDTVHAFRWMNLEDKNRQKAVNAFFDQSFGDPVKLAAEDTLPEQPSGNKTNGTYAELVSILRQARQIADEEGFLHWEVAFPVVWDNWESDEPEGGFDAVIGNPPWDRMKLQEVEWFSARNPQIAYATRAADRKKLIKKLQDKNDSLAQAYEIASERAKKCADVARTIGHYPLLSGGDINLYSLFVERAHRLVKEKGYVGLVVPSGIASDLTSSKFFKSIATGGRLGHLYDFENKKEFFPDIHASFKFSVYIAGGEKRKFRKARMAFFLHNVEELKDKNRVFSLGSVDFARVNPNTGTAPIFRTKRDAQITHRIYEKFPVLREHGKEPVWPVKYFTMFHMTNDSHLFKTRAELETEGFYPVAGNKMKKGREEYLPLYEGKMVQAYDHRAASVVVNPENLSRPAQPESTTVDQYKNPNWYPVPQFWVSCGNLPADYKYRWFWGFKDVTAPTNMRSMIASFIPLSGVGNTIPIFLPMPEQEELFKKLSTALVANMNAFAFDYVARQKIQGQHLNWYIVEQLPVISPEKFNKKIGKIKIADLIRDHVLRLTYTASDMEPFARDMGYKGKPFNWDEDKRRHLRARLDALFFLLYEISRNDAEYIMDTFPIVKRNDEAEFGRYMTRDLILAYMNALAAGDTESTILL